MKRRNKKTGEIKDWVFPEWFQYILNPDGEQSYSCDLAQFLSRVEKFNEEWEDVEEPDEIWYIDWKGDIRSADIDNEWEGEKQIGNYFKTKEEAEKAVERLRAWKRLKDKGFKFTNWNCSLEEIYFKTPDTFFDRPDMLGEAISEETSKDLDLLFGGEE